MRDLLRLLIHSLVDGCRSRRALQLEVLALRHQLAVYQRTVARPSTRVSDRVLWSVLSRHWAG